jgi:hypothetical protein
MTGTEMILNQILALGDIAASSVERQMVSLKEIRNNEKFKNEL